MPEEIEFKVSPGAWATSDTCGGYTTANSAHIDPYEAYSDVSERILLCYQGALVAPRLLKEGSARPIHFKWLSLLQTRSYRVQLGSELRDKIEKLVELDIKGPSEDLGTVGSWISQRGPGFIQSNIESDVNEILSGLKNMQPLPRSRQLLDMADRVASRIAQGEEEDLETWAQRLADDLSGMTD